MKLGFIGTGNMAQALLRGIIAAGMMPAQNIFVYDVDRQKALAISNDLFCNAAQDNQALARECDMLVLAVKPHHVEGVLSEISEFEDKALISIAAGWTRDRLSQRLHKTCRALRVMPNTPCLVGEGMTALDQDHTLTDEELAFATCMFESVGRVISVPSRLMSAVTGMSGSGPAYLYVFIEAMADAGVLNGLDRVTAYELAAQTVLGAGKMVQKTGEHPGKLKDAVCSPGGTTIEAVRALEQSGFRASVIKAVCACTDKAKQMEQ